MKIKIIKANLPSYWYSNLIGRTYKVKKELDGNYEIYYNSNGARYVDKDDCEIVWVERNPQQHTF